MNRPFTRAAHLRAGSPEEAAPNAALLIDFDNVTMAMRSNLALELQRLLNSDIIRGKVAVQRAYADWRRYPQYIVPLSEASIDLIFAPAYGSSKKNATDIRLAVDALEIVFTRPEIGTYILLSGDSDFSSLVLKLKEYGKYVIGVGLQESSSDILVQNCDEYYSYTSLSGLTSATDMQRTRQDPWELVEQALAKMVKRGDVMRSDRLKQVMLELDPSFDEKSAGFSKFNRFLAEAASRQIIRLRKGENGQYEVGPIDRPSAETAAEAPRRPRASRQADRPRVSQERARRTRPEAPEAAKEKPEPSSQDQRGEEVSAENKPSPRATADALRQAYQFLVDTVGSLYADGHPVRDSQVKRKMLAEDESFDETALGFRKFSRFLQQAHDEGVVDLVQGDDGNFYVSPAAGTQAEERQGNLHQEVQQRSEDESRPKRATGRGRDRPQRSGGQEQERRTERGRRGSPVRQSEPAESPARPAVSDVQPETLPAVRKRRLGRFRRGSRGASETRAVRPPTGASVSPPTASLSGPAAAEPPAGQRSAGQRSAEDAVQHMVEHYPGVGRRTASRLVEVFGDRVFEVIDREPSRLSELLSARRARAVIEARKAEKEA